MDTGNVINEFAQHLIKEKRKASNTAMAYERDIRGFEEFLKSDRNAGITEATETDVISYMHRMKENGKSSSTIGRKLSSIRSFYNYLKDRGITDKNPAAGIKTPRVERGEMEYLSIDEIMRILALPDESKKGIRDRAILEVLYATGIKASELIAMNDEDVNFRMGFISCDLGSVHARIVPLGRPAREALNKYYNDIRPLLLKDNKDEKALFLNYKGGRISRQGLWKLLKTYGQKAGLEQDLTPSAIRNSFAMHMLQNGADIKALQELMGYEDISAAQIYLDATKTRIKSVYDKTHPRA